MVLFLDEASGQIRLASDNQLFTATLTWTQAAALGSRLIQLSRMIEPAATEGKRYEPKRES